NKKMANIAIGPSKRNFIVIIIPTLSLRIFRLSLKVAATAKTYHKIAELAHLMPMQLITPEGFTLLNGGPKYRRAFLDWGCFHNE
ncbi:hypothetical protein ONQ97_26085, partial [Salmonella enterica subsp. enterica serovar Virginia]|nr:hypothetical protein [Salmonella enterica subsp. enterica serovar Virginia]